jgi:hypothetical protein
MTPAHIGSKLEVRTLPRGGAPEPAGYGPAPGVAGSVRRQGAPDGKAATEGGPQQGRASRKAEDQEGEVSARATEAAPCPAQRPPQRQEQAIIQTAPPTSACPGRLPRPLRPGRRPRPVPHRRQPSPPNGKSSPSCSPYAVSSAGPAATSTRPPRPSTPAPTHPTSPRARRLQPRRPPSRGAADRLTNRAGGAGGLIPSIHKQGSKTLGLLNYLYGKGTHEEHIDPHLVAAFDGMAPDPGRDPSVTYEDLQHLLDQPVTPCSPDQRPDEHVWHCSVRAAPDDPILSPTSSGATSPAAWSPPPASTPATARLPLGRRPPRRRPHPHHRHPRPRRRPPPRPPPLRQTRPGRMPPHRSRLRACTA